MSSNTRPNPMKRIQLDLNEAEFEDLNRLMEACGITKRKDFFNAATTLFRWAVGEVQDNRSIASLDRVHQRAEILRMAELDFARNTAPIVERREEEPRSNPPPLVAVGDDDERRFG